MDEVKFASKFMRGILAKIIANTLKKKTECKVDISINDFNAFVVDEMVHAHLDCDVEMSKEQFMQLLKKIELF